MEKIKEAVRKSADEVRIFPVGDEDELLDRLSWKMGDGKEESQYWIESISFNRDKAS